MEIFLQNWQAISGIVGGIATLAGGYLAHRERRMRLKLEKLQLEMENDTEEEKHLALLQKSNAELQQKLRQDVLHESEKVKSENEALKQELEKVNQEKLGIEKILFAHKFMQSQNFFRLLQITESRIVSQTTISAILKDESDINIKKLKTALIRLNSDNTEALDLMSKVIEKNNSLHKEES